jgi:hypothetical protein
MIIMLTNDTDEESKQVAQWAFNSISKALQ